ncbi:BspA family leucine-rich repeat surface protein [Hanstruepera ponticola]|uniref:BspA family leucine-rich repeat surface protein n=1 Tax=Hanstruepera ponticola TaxID=2042995 RepID=UPI000CF07A29|nr:BspA family leucine-rich repeat surface protein [Hanstruepera ponticola]
MRHCYFFIALFFLINTSYSQEPFITTWEVQGTDLNIQIGTSPSDYSYNYNVDFGDGTIVNNAVNTIQHVYSSPGIYTVKISGTFPHFNANTVSNDKIRTVEQWGDIEWMSMESTFEWCQNLVINATDSPDLSQVTNTSRMFFNCSALNTQLSDWDVSNVTNMSLMFSGCASFNQFLDNWDISNVTNLSGMFYNCSSFNQSLNNWDVSNVIYMNQMFSGCSSFNQPLNNWNTLNVLNFDSMFNNCSNFNQDISDWTFNTNLFNISDFLSFTDLSILNYDRLLTTLSVSGIQNETLGVYGLEYCNVDSRNYLLNQGWNIQGDFQSQDCNLILGSVYYDSNNDGCSDSDYEVSGFTVVSDNSVNLYSTIVNNSIYEISLHDGVYSVSILNLPPYFTLSPLSYIVDFSSSSEEQIDFCLTANQSVNDLGITILPTTEARPGFEANYKLVIENKGTETINDISVTFGYDSSMQSFVSSLPTPSNETIDLLEFSVGSLEPFQSDEVLITFSTFPPPTVNGDDILEFNTQVLPDLNDYTPNDNDFTLEQIVVNSYDPNDKQVLQGSEIILEETSEYLDYIIRFQNTGTASAINVRIEDILHPNLDWNTIKITSSSHEYDVEIIDGNEVAFNFDNINLPDINTDEQGSNGYIAYKIKPKPSIQVGDIMEGDAAIFFDFNSPIITNLVSTIVIDNLSVPDYNLNDYITIYPNPTDFGVYIKKHDNIQINSISLHSYQGQELVKLMGPADFMSFKNLASGIYLIKFDTNLGILNKKIIIR